MVFIHAATTSPVNPPGCTTVLSRDELWSALLEKARRPELFLSVIERSEVLCEDARGLTRRAVLRPEQPEPAVASAGGGGDRQGKGKEMVEVVSYKGKTRVCLYIQMPLSQALSSRTLRLLLHNRCDNTRTDSGPSLPSSLIHVDGLPR